MLQVLNDAIMNLLLVVPKNNLFLVVDKKRLVVVVDLIVS